VDRVCRSEVSPVRCHTALCQYPPLRSFRQEGDVPDLTSAFHEYAAQCTNVYGALRPITCDVLDRNSIAEAAREISNTVEKDPSRPLVAVVNNAGFCMISPMEVTKREDVAVSLLLSSL
jgi:hypothetical protein